MARQTGPATGYGEARGGIPDGLLIGLLSFLVGLTLLAWSATGLAGLLAHGSWPDGVNFTGAPSALRQLAGHPHDLPAAWPDTPPGSLSGYGLFWGLFIGELLILLVLTVFALGTLARWRGVREQRRADLRRVYERQPAEAPEEAHPQAPRPGTEPAPHTPRSPASRPPAPRPERTRPEAPEPGTTPATEYIGTARTHPEPPGALPVAPPVLPVPPMLPSPRTPQVIYGPATTRRPSVVRAIQDADGAALVVTSDPTVWAETKDARAKLGPVLVYDPGHLCDTPDRLHWSPTAGCEERETAAARAAALLAPVRPLARIDALTAETAETLLQCWLHAAAVDGKPFRQVHRWAQGSSAAEPVRILRTHPKATAGLAGLLESALTGHPERRDMARELTVRAFAALSSVHIREACTPNRADSLALASFVNEGGTLYVVGEPIEDPRSRPGAMPLLTALASDVVEHGRRVAARSSDGRLDPPMALVLDDVAAVAPLPRLPELLGADADHGLPTLVLLRSQEQGRSRWREPLPQSSQH
ncbi:type VI secretion protein [Streptomyces sp. DT24]|uniref:type VI secretion protein n=1 Tax=Streptomyces sp. DT24 TaxID=3416520 RepID=UPI003CE7D2D3